MQGQNLPARVPKPVWHRVGAGTLALGDLGKSSAGEQLQLRRAQTEHRIRGSGRCPNRLEGREIGVEEHFRPHSVAYRSYAADRISGHLGNVARVRAFDLLADQSANL